MIGMDKRTVKNYYDSDKFRQSLEEVAEVVASWPEWKRQGWYVLHYDGYKGIEDFRYSNF